MRLKEERDISPKEEVKESNTGKIDISQQTKENHDSAKQILNVPHTVSKIYAPKKKNVEIKYKT